MSIAENRRIYTPEDLLALPNSKTCELVDGELVEKRVSALSGAVEMIVAGRLYQCIPTDVGQLFSGTTGYQCFSWAAKMIRKPDISFIRKERILADLWDQGFIVIAPDLAVEVVSPNDLVYEIEEKVEEYLRAGVPLVWVIDPEHRTVTIHRKDGSIARLRGNDELSGEDVVPGFRCPVNELFPQQATAVPH